MKRLIQKILEKKLYILSRLILKKYKPKIIGITGSVGKTSAKEAVFCVLSEKFRVRRNVKNYNNELGVPLTIIGSGSGKKNIFKWLGVCLRALGLYLVKSKKYPEVLILEMGADKPGDISYLVKLAPCDVGIVTAIGDQAPVHMEFFSDINELVKEKQNIISHLTKDNWAIVNQDDTRVRGMKGSTKAKVLSIGLNNEAVVKAEEVKVSGSFEKGMGLAFKLRHKGSIVPVFMEGALGQHQIYAALFGAAVGIAFEMNLIDIANRLKKFKSPPGRMNLIAGIKDTFIIDDSYNSSPAACLAALDVLDKMPIKEGRKKFAVLGDMAELGEYTEESHVKIGYRAAEAADIIVTVGEKAKMISESAKKSGLSEDRIFEFAASDRAGRFLQDRIGSGDLLLVKGSQSVRMEKIVKELMAEPMRAKELLIRQDKDWVKK